MHALGAVLAWRAAIIVDALGLAFATAHTGTAGAQRRATDDGGHGERRDKVDEGRKMAMTKSREEVRGREGEELREKGKKGRRSRGRRRCWFGGAEG